MLRPTTTVMVPRTRSMTLGTSWPFVVVMMMLSCSVATSFQMHMEYKPPVKSSVKKPLLQDQQRRRRSGSSPSAIVAVEASIQTVEEKISAIEGILEKEGLSDADIAYYRQEKDRLCQKEDRLRKEKEQLREEKLLLLKRQQPPPPQMQSFLDPERKRQKNFSTLLKQKDVDGAHSELLEAATPYFGPGPDLPKSYRLPFRHEDCTWDEERMRGELCRKREILRPRLSRYRPNDRQQVVIGIRLGTGFGKTHVLTEAPALLNAKGIYVTYNLNQDLTADRKQAAKAVLIRLILALSGYGSQKCDMFLNSENSGPFLEASTDDLRSLFVDYAASQNFGDIAIGVDELMELDVRNAQIVVSQLAEVAALYLSKTNSMCTVLVSSLASATFVTASGRPVEDWLPRRPDIKTLEYFARSLEKSQQKKAIALVGAVSGGHMRSIVIAFDLYRNVNMEASVQYMFKEMAPRMGSKLSTETLKDIRKYVSDCITSPHPQDCSSHVELAIDKIGAVPPVFLMMAFKDDTKVSKHLKNLLNAFSLFDGGCGKHLENVSKHYDLFRARLLLPVVPGGVHVSVLDSGKTQKWFKQLRFHDEMSVSEAALLKQESDVVNGKKRSVVVATGEVPKFGRYYHPKISNHPLIDRLYVVQHEDTSLCLVLVQDKVNADDFPQACDKLNQAADLLTTIANIEHVLLIVNVIGATESTRAQEKLKWPFILIRGLNEVRSFYSVNFADMVWFSRERHLLSL